jgi:SAM-dependent methyltransferase
MHEVEYAHMHEEEERHWWYVGMRAIMSALLAPDSLPREPLVLDAGCGTGYNMGWLRQKYGARVTGIDFSSHALDFCRRRGEHCLARADASYIPMPDNVFDLVVSFDVITHLNDEQARSLALREFLRILKPGGRAVLRVPACKFLRSGHDEAVMARHRYRKKELGDAVAGAGFRVLRLTGANTILFPAALVWRTLKRVGLAPGGSDVRSTTRGKDGLNRALGSILEFEAAILRRCSFPFGLSLILLAAKPANEGNRRRLSPQQLRQES